MKTILFTCLLLGAIAGAQAQSANDPFFNAGHARTLNPRILGGSQATPWLVNSAIHNLRDGGTATAPLVNFIKNTYGYAVWDRSLAFTAHGNATALVPLVFPEGSSITGVLVVVQQDGALRYGIMDLVHPFPFVASGTQAPGMPGFRDVLAHFAYFNHVLFGSAHCAIIHALHATMPQNSGYGDEAQAKNCFYHIEVVQNCWAIYGVMSNGTEVHLYTDCVTTINYTTICLLPGGGGFPVSTPGDPSQPVSGPPGSNDGTGITDLEENCAAMDVHKCGQTRTLSNTATNTYGSSCSVSVRIAGCRLEYVNVYLQAMGIAGCGFSVGSGKFGDITFVLDFSFSLQNVFTTSYLTSVTSSDPLCNVSIRCGAVIVEYQLVSHVLGIPYVLETRSESFSDICYTCRNCPN